MALRCCSFDGEVGIWPVSEGFFRELGCKSEELFSVFVFKELPLRCILIFAGFCVCLQEYVQCLKVRKCCRFLARFFAEANCFECTFKRLKILSIIANCEL